VIFWQALSLKYYTKFGPGPGMFPLWLSGLFIVVSLVYIWQSIKKEVILFAEILPQGKALGNILAVLGSLILFMVLVNFTGFIIASSVLLFIVLTREYKWYLGLGISVSASILLFLLFQKVFSIPLPVNVFGW
jgi:hypothetical protein